MKFCTFLFPLLLLGFAISAEDQPTCVTESCIHASHHLLLNMDLTADPCSDFNQFSCGGFQKSNFIDEEVGETTEFTKARENLNDKILHLLRDKRLPEDQEFDTDSKIRNFYRGCEIFKEQKNDIQIYGSPLKYTLKNIGLENWPFDETSWEEGGNSIQWFDIVANMVKEGVVFADGFLELPIVNVEVGINDFNESHYGLKVDQPDFDYPFDRKTLANKDIDDLNDIFTQVQDFVIANQDLDAAMVNNAMQRSIEIEAVLYKNSDDSENDNSIRKYGILQDKRNYTKLTIDELPDLPCAYPCSEKNLISWPRYIQSLFDSSEIQDIVINGNDTVIAKHLDYLKNLNNSLEAAKVHEWEWANYLGFKLLQNFQTVQEKVKEEFGDSCENYLISGKKISRFGLLHGAVGSMYVRKYFSEKKKQDVESMVNYIKEGFKQCICQNPSFRWMDKETQSAALDKINAMATDIGYPPELVNKTIIDTYYQGEFLSVFIEFDF